MNIQVEIIKENKDGSADALVHFDKAGLEILVQYGILAMLKQAINEYSSDLKISNKKVKK
jgi:hypothetical protein